MTKYKINFLLKQLSKEEYDSAMKILPKILGVSRRTFFNWKGILLGDSTSIPVDKFILLSEFFGVEVKDLFTNPPSLKFEEPESSLAATLNLSK